LKTLSRAKFTLIKEQFEFAEVVLDPLSRACLDRSFELYQIQTQRIHTLSRFTKVPRARIERAEFPRARQTALSREP
jgi:hypothetical protein